MLILLTIREELRNEVTNPKLFPDGQLSPNSIGIFYHGSACQAETTLFLPSDS